MQSPPKPQFASWLIEQVETGQYPGLRYVSATRFRVPWKHNSRKDCSDEDSKIFRAWAVASGKISEFPTDKARWKTNFRCALNNLSERFKMIKDNSKMSEDPHKIYEIVNTERANTCEHPEIPPTHDFPDDSDMIPDIFCSPTGDVPTGNEFQLLNNFMALDLGNQPVDEQTWPNNYGQPPPTVYLGPAENIPPVIPDQPVYYEPNPLPVPYSPPQHSLYDLEVSIFYRKKEMLKTTITASRLQLHYQREAPELNAYPLCFPSTDGLLDHKQVDYTNRILSSIQRGLLLEVRDTGIYALRQDRCHVFASTSDPSVRHPDPRKLPPNTLEELLSFEKFVDELKNFKEHNGASPEYTINMCFGEKFPDGKALEKKLIVVRVVPLICRQFHEMAQMEGASSLHSFNVSLQLSHGTHNHLFDLISATFSPPAAEEPALEEEHYYLHQV